MNFRIYYPCSTGAINQGFGSNPQYYSKFHDSFGNPLKGHDGIDFRALHGIPTYAAHDGMAHFERDSHGGEGVWIRGDGFSTIYWHLIGDTDSAYPSPIPTDGKEYPVKAGDLIGYADNTGAPYESSGDHLHFGLLPDNPDFTNGFNGRIDPAPFFTGDFAQDVPQLIEKATSRISLLQRLVGLYQAIKNLRK